MTATFESLGLPESILAAIKKVGFTAPTPIQAAAIPLAMDGRDILGSAQTGTGKTAAFGIPMIAKLIAEPKSMAIVMTPTRELAAQVLSTLHPLLAGQRDIRTALLIGGEAMPKQYQQLRQNPRIIVGTPGRINDHLERKSLKLDGANFLVLDETDRMLDMGFGIQIDRILKFMPHQRQTLLFSATIPAEIEKMAQRYQNKPERVSVGSTTTAHVKIKQEILNMKEGEKPDMLIQQLYDRKGSIIVFVKTKFGAKRMAEKLSKMDFAADAIHGNLNQNKRDKVIKAFRDKKYRVLVATDVAARGLDIPHIEHVINYDLPQCPEDYIHRIGRTARAGAEGNAVAFVTPSDGRLWHAIHKLMNPGDKTPAPRTNDRPQNRRGRDGKPGGGAKKFGGARKFGDRKFGEKKFGGERNIFEKPEGGKFEPREKFGHDRFEGDRSERPERSEGRRSEGARKEGGRSFAPRGEGAGEERSYARPKTSRFKRTFGGGGRPQGERERGEGRSENRSAPRTGQKRRSY